MPDEHHRKSLTIQSEKTENCHGNLTSLEEKFEHLAHIH
jgi:hypothetical protein